jgi:hypothetical protein
MPIIPNFNKESPRASGGIWWFAVLAGALAVAFSVRYFVNGGFSSGSAIATGGYILLAVAGLVSMGIGLLKAFRSSLEDTKPVDEVVLNINTDDQ